MSEHVTDYGLIDRPMIFFKLREKPGIFFLEGESGKILTIYKESVKSHGILFCSCNFGWLVLDTTVEWLELGAVLELKG